MVSVTINNVDPTLKVIGNQTVSEGSLLSIPGLGTFTDPGFDNPVLGTVESFTYRIDWGDGTVPDTGAALYVSGSEGVLTTGSFDGSHLYADNGVYTVEVTVTDDDSGTDSGSFVVTVENVAPDLAPLADQPSVPEGQFITLGPATFTDPGFDSVLNADGEIEESFVATIDWGDGTTEPVGDVILTETDGSPGVPTTGTIDASHAYADNGTYTVTVTVYDDDSGTDAEIFQVIVANVAPSLTVIIDEKVNEGEVIFLLAEFMDTGFDNPLNIGGEKEESFTYSIDWGDETSPDTGVPAEVNGNEGVPTVGSFTTNHVYADDGVYPVTVTLADDDGGVVTATWAVTVKNLAPTVDAGSDQTVDEGQMVSLDPATFNDLGTFDTHTVTIDWGDGTAIDIGVVTEAPFGPPGSTSGADGTVSGSHVYADDGIYTVEVTVTDDDGASTSDTLTITVLNVAPTVDAGSDQTVNEGDLVELDPATFNDLGTLDTHTATIDWGDGSPLEAGVVTEVPFGSPGSTSGTDGTVDGSHVYADNGAYTVTVTVFDDDGASTSGILTVTVLNVAPTVTADCTTQEVQYSDQIQEVSFSATDPSIDTMNAQTSYSIDGVTFFDGLPDAVTIVGELSFDVAANQQTPATWTLSGIADLAPGTYVIRVTVTDGDGGTGFADTTIVVAPEDARSTYVGPMFVSTLSINETIAIVELRAVIQDITFYPEDANWDPNAGHITTSTMSFINFDTGETIEARLDVLLIDPSDPTTGVAVCEWVVNLGNADSESFTVECVVDGFYSCPAEQTVITVSKPLRDFITGGGYLINESSAGIYAGDPGLKTNFGFNVKFNKKLTNLQGKVNAIIRKDGRLYQIKTNATQSLVVDPINNTATFLSKANLKDITDPNYPISITGNLTCIVTLTDLGEPGTSDSISFTLWKKNELWFSSNWTGAQTLEQVLAGGNLIVHAESLALHAADGSADEQTDGQWVTPELLEPVVEEAVLRWADYGIGSKHISTLQDVEFRIADLAGSTIGLTFGNTIWLDIDAAGYGWFIDSTPWDDAEFSRRNTGSELVAKRTSEAYGDIDLLTVVMHEMGHTLGFEDLTSEAESKDLMYEMLQSGVRRTKTLPATRRSTTHSAVAWHYLGSRQKDNLLLNSWFSDWLRRYEELASRSRAH